MSKDEIYTPIVRFSLALQRLLELLERAGIFKPMAKVNLIPLFSRVGDSIEKVVRNSKVLFRTILNIPSNSEFRELAKRVSILEAKMTTIGGSNEDTIPTGERKKGRVRYVESTITNDRDN